ncbi:MAG: hypothetical protein H7249_08225 [Chitinophagaceae bacterium]|nr:hypothetical protein [Oligoflexus sp.]
MTNFISALKGLIKKPAAPLEGKRESRVYQRFNLNQSKLFFVQLPNGELTPIINLSFGGMGIRKAPEDTDTFPIVIRFLSRSISARLTVTHRGKDYVGTRFEDRDQALISFLQPLLEGIGHGLSMRTIDSSALKDQTKNSYEWVLRGEGPSDLLIASSGDPCSDTHMTFRSGKDYLELSIKANQLTTGKSLDDNGRAARMTRDSSPDGKVLDQALLILTGTMEQASLQTAVIPVIERICQAREGLPLL